MPPTKRRSPKAQGDPATDIELRPDGWERFGKAVDAAVKSGPKHRSPHKPPEPSGERHRETPPKGVKTTPY
jgi:hypothetical protein